MNPQEVKMSPVAEALSTRRDLDWVQDDEVWETEFSIEDRRYGITAQSEINEGLTFLRFDFHLKTPNGISHVLTGFNKDQFKVLGIVTNGIKDQFPIVDGYYFAAKQVADPEGYSDRVKTYRRILDRLRVELNLVHHVEKRPDETIFFAARTNDALKIMTSSV